MTKELIPSEIL